MNQLEIILENTAQVFPKDELIKKLEKNIPLRIKLGADPTAPNLHLGHVVVLEKLRELQNLGHKIIFLIGDFTAKIGDPTGKSKTRPPLSDEEIKKNAQTYFQQIGRILDINKTEVVYNSTWIEPLNLNDWLKVCSKVTLSRLIERDDFKKRLNSQIPIGFHEMMYPLMQGYDSVYLKADIEVGGTDQTFNLIMGRHLQEQFEQEAQVVITMPLLEGLDGVNKMSKSLKNDIGLLDEPEDVFGKIMSINDSLMWNYYKILLRFSKEQIDLLKKDHPMDVKKNLAYLILKKYWSENCANKGKSDFSNKFQNKNYETAKELFLEKNEYKLVDLIILADNELSKSEAKRLVNSNSISINNEKIVDENFIYKKNNGDVLKIGKIRIYKII